MKKKETQAESKTKAAKKAEPSVQAAPVPVEEPQVAAPSPNGPPSVVPARVREGVVIKNRMQKTVVVEVARRISHGKYIKQVKRRLRYAAHDAAQSCSVGDLVRIEETRPMSKTKRWRVKEILQKAVEI
ncbi:MAG: 30S ribosomal protein S17 [Deltaproteobacteria bacterium]|nr:30S ribosomal protein S17 [Deltaproteobacteria bacterium]